MLIVGTAMLFGCGGTTTDSGDESSAAVGSGAAPGAEGAVVTRGGSTSSGQGASSGTTFVPGSRGEAVDGGADGTVTDPEPALCDEFIGVEDPQGICAQSSEAVDLRRPNVLLVVDKSGSMSREPPGFGADKWSALQTALGTTLDRVKGIVSFGLQLFPDRSVSIDCDTTTCCQMPTNPEMDVPIAEGTVTVPRIIETLEQTSPGGGTPTAIALRRALEYYTVGSGAALEGDKLVMLVTDGAPNCNDGITCDSGGCTVNLENRCSGTQNCCVSLWAACVDDQATRQALSDLRSAGIDTLVVGIPGSEPYAAFLDDYALAGGRPNMDGPTAYYAVDSADGVDGLTSVLTAITAELAISCDFLLPHDPPDAEKLNVAVDCEVIPRAQTADAGTSPAASSWALDPSTIPSTVTLLGPVCSVITEEGVDRIDLIFGCPTLR